MQLPSFDLSCDNYAFQNSIIGLIQLNRHNRLPSFFFPLSFELYYSINRDVPHDDDSSLLMVMMVGDQLVSDCSNCLMIFIYFQYVHHNNDNTVNTYNVQRKCVLNLFFNCCCELSNR